MRLFLLLFALLPGLAFATVSPPVSTPRDSVTLVSHGVSINGDVNLALHFVLSPGWHIYWSNPGDAGLAPQITLAPPAIAGPLNFPPPDLLIEDSVASYVLTGDVVLPFTAAHAGRTITATAAWLVCRDVCVPEHANFTVAAGPAERSPPAPPAIIASPFPASIAPDGTLSLIGPTRTQVAAAHFFPDVPGAIVNRATQTLTFSATGLALHLATAGNFSPSQTLAGVLELTDRTGATQALAVTATPGAAPAGTPFLLDLAAAFLGGLILNLMPCVFPILAMKALALARLTGAQRPAIRREVFGYTAGVLTAMLALATSLLVLRAAGAAIGWGFQLQSPACVALIAWLIFAAALNLAGRFDIGAPALRFAGGGSFFTGLLAVVLATPCTAPFMAGALAAALAGPPAAALVIFLALGLGLAAPFLVLAFAPALIARLPKPGAWMMRLQRLLSIPMFFTFAWLAWLFLREAGAVNFGIFCAGSVAAAIGLTMPKLRLAVILPASLLALFSSAGSAPALTLPGAEPYAAARLAALRAAGTPVFVDMTAAWCVTCLVNERASLSAPPVQALFRRDHVETLVGDWTSRDPAITAYLARNNRAGVPLYVFYPPGGGPVTLPQILTPGLVQQMITNALAPRP